MSTKVPLRVFATIRRVCFANGASLNFGDCGEPMWCVYFGTSYLVPLYAGGFTIPKYMAVIPHESNDVDLVKQIQLSQSNYCVYCGGTPCCCPKAIEVQVVPMPDWARKSMDAAITAATEGGGE